MMTQFVCAVLLLQAAGLPTGPSRVELDLGGTALEVFTYKPPTYRDGPLILVFHGVLRNADEYRDDARAMGDRFGALIVAPRFDAARFPSRKYQRGGLLREDGTAAPPEEWTWSLVPKLAEAIRRLEGRPEMPYYLIGHSAGGQFVGRMAAFVDSDAGRLVVSNPSSYVMPTRDADFGYGFGGLPGTLGDDEHLRRYLARPVTIYLGTADTERDEDLDTSPEADRQGRNRLERGRNAFRAAERIARERGWDFRWRLVEAPDVGHDHRAMFDHPRSREALFGDGESAGTH